VEYLEPVLAEQGEVELVRNGIAAVFERGTGAEEQRRVRQTVIDKAAPDDGGLAAVVAHAVRATMRGTDNDLETDPVPAPELVHVRQP